MCVCTAMYYVIVKMLKEDNTPYEKEVEEQCNLIMPSCFWE